MSAHQFPCFMHFHCLVSLIPCVHLHVVRSLHLLSAFHYYRVFSIIFFLSSVNDDTTGPHLVPGIGVGTLLFCFYGMSLILSINLFLHLKLCKPDFVILYALVGSRLCSTFIQCLNHSICCHLVYLMYDIITIVYPMSLVCNYKKFKIKIEHTFATLNLHLNNVTRICLFHWQMKKVYFVLLTCMVYW